MSAYVIFDVAIRDMATYRQFMEAVKPALEAAGGTYLARGGEHQVYEGDWNPRRVQLRQIDQRRRPSVELITEPSNNRGSLINAPTVAAPPLSKGRAGGSGCGGFRGRGPFVGAAR
jgi:hypothetical protein